MFAMLLDLASSNEQKVVIGTMNIRSSTSPYQNIYLGHISNNYFKVDD